MSTYTTESNIEETCLSEEELLDSCAFSKLFIIRDQSCLESFVYSGGAIQTTRAGVQLACQGSGKYRDWVDIRMCNESVKNICSAGLLREMGYGLQLMRVPRIVRLCDGQKLIRATYSENGMPYLTLVDVLNLPNLNNEGVALEEVHLSDSMNFDPLDLLHERCGHYSKSKLLEGFKHMLFTGSGLTRAHLSKSFSKKLRGHLCKSCAKGKITRRSFREAEPEVLSALRFLVKVTADIAVYLNCPSRQGFRYVLVLTDVATKMFWEYPLNSRSGDEVLCYNPGLKTLGCLDNTLKSFTKTRK